LFLKPASSFFRETDQKVCFSPRSRIAYMKLSCFYGSIRSSVQEFFLDQSVFCRSTRSNDAFLSIRLSRIHRVAPSKLGNCAIRDSKFPDSGAQRSKSDSFQANIRPLKQTPRAAFAIRGVFLLPSRHFHTGLNFVCLFVHTDTRCSLIGKGCQPRTGVGLGVHNTGYHCFGICGIHSRHVLHMAHRRADCEIRKW